MYHNPMAVKVWGDLALFSRPELKAERVSYPLPPPSAARGILESIFWKPEFRWRIREIHVLQPQPISPSCLAMPQPKAPTYDPNNADEGDFYRFLSVMRNEVDRKATETPISITESRTQRHSLMLRDPAYLIYADIELRPDVKEDAAKYRDQFQRRVKQGQCFQSPFLGCRECPCAFAPLDGTEESERFRHEKPIPLGRMLFDFKRDAENGVTPVFFEAELEDGILKVGTDMYRRHGL